MFSGNADKTKEKEKGAGLIALTWNIAAINNNPFEYYITHKDPKYNELMEAVQEFIDAPGAADVSVDTVFTDDMFAQLKVVAHFMSSPDS